MYMSIRASPAAVPGDPEAAGVNMDNGSSA